MSKRPFPKILPFIWLGILFVLIAGGLVLLSYILIWGCIIGCAAYGILQVVQFFSGGNLKQKIKNKPSKNKKREPITIDQEED